VITEPYEPAPIDARTILIAIKWGAIALGALSAAAMLAVVML